MNLLKCLTFMLILGTCLPVSAKLVQIIHTNDLHSFFNGTRSGLGGYSRIKTLMDELKSSAAAKGIKTLILDAGDFGEGSSYYFSDRGVDSLRALDMLGIDVTVLGNHDFILGGKELSRQMKASKLKAKLLSANLKGKPLMGLQKLMPDFVDYDIDGMKIRIFGLTTPELHFQYPLRPWGYIAPSHKTGIKMAEKSQREGVDFLIALTHIGLDKDMTLVSHSRSIDLVVGGHSHTRLPQPKMIENLKGELVPILQTGAHGIAVGSLLVDIHGNGESTMIDYKLYDVTKDIEKEQTVQAFVDNAELNREKYFNRSWDEVIGFSEITFTGFYNGRVRNQKSCWSKHIARLTKNMARADLGLQFDIFQGEEIPAGIIKFGDLIDNFPHFNKWGDKGWNIARATVPGIILKKILGALSTLDEPVDVTIDGVYAIENGIEGMVPYQTGGRHQVENARIKGKTIQDFKFYSVGLPSEIPYSIGKMSWAVRDLLLSNLEYVDNSNYWTIMENYIKKNSPLKCLKD